MLTLININCEVEVNFIIFMGYKLVFFFYKIINFDFSYIWGLDKLKWLFLYKIIVELKNDWILLLEKVKFELFNFLWEVWNLFVVFLLNVGIESREIKI